MRECKATTNITADVLPSTVYRENGLLRHLKIPLAELDSFWREIFTTPSAEDTRSPISAGPTQCVLVVPVTRDVLLAALKGMKAGPPVPTAENSGI